MNKVLTSITISITLMLGKIESAASLNLLLCFVAPHLKGGGEHAKVNKRVATIRCYQHVLADIIKLAGR